MLTEVMPKIVPLIILLVFYSRLLGLAFDFQIIDAIPTDFHDKPVQRIITETQVITCEK